MIKDLEACDVTWYSVLFKWRFATSTATVPRVILTEVLKDSTKTYVHYRGKKKRFQVVGLSPNTTYTFNLGTASPDNNDATNHSSDSDKNDIQTHPDAESDRNDVIKHSTDNELEVTTSTTDDGVILANHSSSTDKANSNDDVITENNVASNDDVTKSLTVSFITAKCGKHDARLIAAIEDHSLAETKRISSACPEVINIPDKTGLSPMMYAAARGYPSLIRILEEQGGNVDYCNPSGKTALMLGAYHGHTHVISTLMELGCDWRKLDNAGCTALHYSIERGNKEICEALVTQGADVNMPDSRGYTGLTSLCLADREDVEMASFLLENNADPNTVSPSGETCVMAAARTNKAEVLKTLIQYNADVILRTRYGHTALDMANPGSHCHDMLQEYFPEDSDSD